MEALAPLVPYIPQAAIPLVVCICFYFYIQSKRKVTKVERDKDSQEIHDKILRHDFEIANLKGEFTQQKNINEDLSKQIIELSRAVTAFASSVDSLKEIVKDLKDDVKELRR